MSNTVVAYGGGVNSTALLVGLRERGERPDAILFADTGGERPQTYEHIERMQAWCAVVGFPAIVVVRDTYRAVLTRQARMQWAVAEADALIAALEVQT